MCIEVYDIAVCGKTVGDRHACFQRCMSRQYRDSMGRCGLQGLGTPVRQERILGEVETWHCVGCHEGMQVDMNQRFTYRGVVLFRIPAEDAGTRPSRGGGMRNV